MQLLEELHVKDCHSGYWLEKGVFRSLMVVSVANVWKSVRFILKCRPFRVLSIQEMRQSCRQILLPEAPRMLAIAL